ncbi:hypothetical protein L1987_85170 [Smallanthus sonchifolius]|uniref:Uncharacterized protein n=6 Tax=Smallanthus sonchifolius TaxID=185202 RepID=A0ACB8XVN9_9ASTR|nr:hypothetical protein L1987_85138 [Smallanthus sonchifolius]KAI3675563.1 hypothetical protein L1987_85153 [Smallanthus sonchifolius]KAI3675567.1 hypothetical protein L1987_85157 [Smallanthus sonchifolius]KAI3675580.1 hypothetical protein L1987_85170 [Smallanthus sonchifolius]
MAKLVALALAFAALVVFATAHTTIVTTTIEDENPVSRQRQCSQRLQGQRFNQCRMYLQQGQSPFEDNRQWGQQQQGIQQCCQELRNVEDQCQCEAVKKVFRDVQQQQGHFGSQQTQQLKQRAQMLPNQCNLQSRQCQIGNIMTESNIDIPFRTGSQQCRETEIQRPVNQCQRFVEQQIRSPRTIEMSTNRPGRQQQQGLQQCCDELQNVRRECQCEAIKEVARKMMRQQGGRTQYGGQQEQTEIVRRVVQNLPNQCYLEVQQCSIPY